MTTTMTIDDQMALIRRGVEAIYTEDDLRRKLESGRPLRIKLGLDPTAPDIHLGHTVVLTKMRQFQDLGHKAVVIIGDYTARIGDPTGRDTTRPVLDEQTIEQNARTYLDQAGLILDLDPAKFELRYNSEWLGDMDLGDVLRLTGTMTVQQMLHRDNFRQRMAADREIMITEFLYPLMQAQDSVVIDADVELGGTDQTFNNLCGRDLMGKAGKPRQVVLIMPILVGLDGTEKMSKSKGNYVAVTDPADEMFGKVMSLPDNLMANYFRLLTPLPEDRIHSLVDAKITHPRQAKDILARVLVEEFHGLDAANAASAEFKRRFSENQLPSEIETRQVAGLQWSLAALIAAVGFAASNGEAKRLIKQGGVRFDDKKVDDPGMQVTLEAGRPVLLQIGKRRVCYVCGSAS